MARTDFEKHMKEKLENRSIQPSSEVWDNLSERLDENENLSSNKMYWWLGIAAGFIGILFTVTVFTKTNEVVPVIVNAPVEQVEDIQITTHKDTLKNDTENTVNPIQELIEIKQNTIQPKQDGPIVIAKVGQAQTKGMQSPNEQIQKEMSFEDQKIQEVVAKVNDLKSKKSIVTEAEIDKLLLEAQREINSQRIINQSTGIVNADLLLQEVEMELDQSFRSKVLEALKSGFGTVKTAIAQRKE